MNQDQIKALAKQAGGTPYVNRHYPGETAVAFGPVALTEFVRLVRAEVLDEAAAACTAIAVAPSNCVLGVAINCADKIRSMKA